MYAFLRYRVSDFMTHDPVSVTPETSIHETERLLEKHDFNGVPVLGEDGGLLGVATKLDLLKAFRFTEERIVPGYEETMARAVREIMSPAVEWTAPSKPLTRVLERMVQTRCRSLPVLDEGKLVGMIAREDVLRALHRAAGTLGPNGPQGNS